ncbi:MULTISPECIES: hypothetical protein [Pseudoalteromonas]|uniref:DUF1360 domain-containing protein n=1 Tax=Pseudoalteromonas luteoviolacea (strain 2ta16) TaxID=1353533 RepID=V4HK44_PSEL2|nr:MULTISPECIES: hypothetical protein [Pseudoalteromonas]ESP91210.1 hypothetical protein PL2TA16_01081 [Pseudoalteromonas luteoviolacea 2ta16]KZN31413.1 hypothetical protein N483_06250 [Pseudoalteromonas luteoviolacea NCIMB 1944]MCG7548662.1 hypothetical protein [Pseudoalteromonas sp. Of7M-16]
MIESTETINFSTALLGLTLHILIWEKLPDWGTWFTALIHKLPKPLAYLYEAWQCPYCFGFWIALCLHGITQQFTLPGLQVMPGVLGIAAVPIAWFLDALVTALFIYVGSLLLKALAGPALSGHQQLMAFKQSQK